MHKLSLVAIFTVAAVVVFPIPLAAQDSLATQRAKCSELRSEVSTARRRMQSQESRSETEGETQKIIIDAMRRQGKSEAQIDAYRSMANMQHRWGGTLSNARREYESARESYELQGCATGGTSTYNYDAND